MDNDRNYMDDDEDVSNWFGMAEFDDLPDDFFFKGISERIKDSPTEVMLKQRLNIGSDRESGLVAEFDFGTDEVLIGAKHMADLRYFPTPDYRGVDQIVKWYQGFCSGFNGDFPEVHIAEPEIPREYLDRNPDLLILETKLVDLGYAIYEPGIKEFELIQSSFRSYVGVKDASNFVGKAKDEKIFDKYGRMEDRFVDENNVLSLQFNPFLPISKPYILNFTENGNVFSGQYEVRGKTYSFRYDMNDSRFRLHPDIWMSVFFCGFSVSNGNYAIYDLVGNFDFLEDRTLFPRVSYETPLCVQPYSTDRVPRWPYSFVGPWKGFLIKGISSKESKVFSPSMTPPMIKNDVMAEIRCNKVTNYAFIVNDMLHYKRMIYPLSNGSLVFPKYEDFWSRRLFIRYKKFVEFDKVKYYFELFEKNENGSFRFVEVPFLVKSYPRNVHSSIVYRFDCPTLLDFVSNYEFFVKDIHYFLPTIYKQGLTKDEKEVKIKRSRKLDVFQCEQMLKGGYSDMKAASEDYTMRHLKLRDPEIVLDSSLNKSTKRIGEYLNRVHEEV
jgi:hypothetical protein